jgi:Ca-activated chloride channel family protein
MKPLRYVLLLLAGAFLCVCDAGSARAAGLLLADGGLGGAMEIVDHEVRVTVNNGVAVTHVNQVFRNLENRQVEALYTFPVPKGASVANFSMWINGKEMTGEVVEKQRAREIYNSYKQQRRDPGLLEQADYRTFEMRVFPVAPKADQRVSITYYQEMEYDHDCCTYVYPLATVTRAGAADSRTTGKFAFSFECRSAVPIAAVESPSHPDQFAVAHHTPDFAQASLETKAGSLNRDVVLVAKLQRPRTGIDVVASRRGREDGFFLLTLTVGDDLKKLDSGMDYVFLLDVSGSMGDDAKLATAKESAGAFVRALGPDDRFELVTFSVQPNPLFRALQPATDENAARAEAFLGTQAARGGTVLKPAMTLVYQYASPDRPLNVVVLSDGMTEQAERTELLRLIQQRPRNARVFCIGVGNDVNRPLMEQLAEDSGGLAAFVSRSDDFARQAQAFRRKLLRPAASGLQIRVDGVPVYDLEPLVLPDLYHGAPVRLYGRYRGGGPATVHVQADVRGVALKQTASVDLPAAAANPEIERMWASKRIDRLLKTADRNGSRESAIPEVVSLGEAYSIVTEYTSFLVLENDAEYQRWKIERRNDRRVSDERGAQTRRAADLETLRAKAAADLGPEAIARPAAPAAVPQAAAAVPANQAAAPSLPAASPLRVRGFDLNLGDGGSGPVGPLFVAAAAWLTRWRKRREAARDGKQVQP